MNTCIQMHLYSQKGLDRYAYIIRTHKQIYKNICVCAHVCLSVFTYIFDLCKYMHMIHSCVYIYIYICMYVVCVCVCLYFTLSLSLSLSLCVCVCVCQIDSYICRLICLVLLLSWLAAFKMITYKVFLYLHFFFILFRVVCWFFFIILFILFSRIFLSAANCLC